MPLNKPKTNEQLYNHILFWPVVSLAFAFWCGYRFLFHFPVWFDETLGKAVFFGLPVWFYIVSSGRKNLLKPLDFIKFEPGLFLGLAVGGVYGFTTILITTLQQGASVTSVPIFASSVFWYEFGLSIMTGFWESLFFFIFLGGVIGQKWSRAGLTKQVIITAGLFLLFHAPNIFLRFSFSAMFAQMFLLTLFALGQSLLFFRWKNFYALIFSQAIWGMVLLIHLSM